MRGKRLGEKGAFPVVTQAVAVGRRVDTADLARVEACVRQRLRHRRRAADAPYPVWPGRERTRHRGADLAENTRPAGARSLPGFEHEKSRSLPAHPQIGAQSPQ